MNPKLEDILISAGVYDGYEILIASRSGCLIYRIKKDDKVILEIIQNCSEFFEYILAKYMSDLENWNDEDQKYIGKCLEYIEKYWDFDEYSGEHVETYYGKFSLKYSDKDHVLTFGNERTDYHNTYVNFCITLSKDEFQTLKVNIAKTIRIIYGLESGNNRFFDVFDYVKVMLKMR